MSSEPCLVGGAYCQIAVDLRRSAADRQGTAGGSGISCDGDIAKDMQSSPGLREGSDAAVGADEKLGADRQTAVGQGVGAAAANVPAKCQSTVEIDDAVVGLGEG